MEVASHPFWAPFSSGSKDSLLSKVVDEKHAGGSYLFREGDPGDGVYLVLEGEVEIVLSAGKKEKVVGRIPPGEYFGEVSVLDGRGRSTAARALGDLRTAKVPRDVLLATLSAEPGGLAMTLLRHSLSHVRNANDLVVSEIVNKEKLSLVGEMANFLMHDLRTPVSCIRMGTELVSTVSTDDSIKEWCDTILLQCDRLVAMATDLTDFSRGDSKLALAPTTNEKFVEMYRKFYGSYLEKTPVNVSFEAVPAQIEIDTARLIRVVHNLISNAVDALAKTPNPRVAVRLAVEDSTLKVTVSDNGPGIPEEIQGTLFDPFVTHGKSGGIGLGMAIVRNIVIAHGGTISFETKPGVGTTFLVSIPQKRPLSKSLTFDKDGY